MLLWKWNAVIHQNILVALGEKAIRTHQMPRCLYKKVRYFRGFCVLVVGGAYV
jgi:hypothetical protein